MVEKRKQCFVISPIGEDGSDVRQHADDVFAYIIEEALRGYHFDVVRADMISRPGKITDDMIEYIQNAELCIIVLTGHNPNGYYECGRRHETGKPYIHLIQKDHTALFDLKDFRIVYYDLSSLKSAKESVEKLRDAIDYYEQSGYGQTTGVSLAAINDSLKRIDRRIEALIGQGAATPARMSQGKLPAKYRLDPRSGFVEASV